MPPFVPRKRERVTSPDPTPPSKRQATLKAPAKRTKTSVFEDVEALDTKSGSIEKARNFLDAHDSDSDSSDLSDADDSDDLVFENIPSAKREAGHGTDPAQARPSKNSHDDGDDVEDEDDDGMEWEDATYQPASSSKPQADKEGQNEIGDLSISMTDDGGYIAPLVSGATGTKGPSKRERQVRIQTHCLHVQLLMWHNTIRNSWINDADLQSALVDGLPETVKRAVTVYREATGTLSKSELEAKKKAAAAKNRKGKRGRKGKDDTGRDWGYRAEHTEQGIPDVSHGDPLLTLIKVLTAYWRKRFCVTAPGIRKLGYMDLKRLGSEVKDWRRNPWDAEAHGERIETRAALKGLAKNYEGSRDVGAQLFVALLRGLKLEARLVANLQPAGIGWSKVEEAAPKKPKTKTAQVKPPVDSETADKQKAPSKRAPSSTLKKPVHNATNQARSTPATVNVKKTKPTRQSARGNKATDPIDLDGDDSPLSSPPSDFDDTESRSEGSENDDDFSVVDLDPPLPKRPNLKFDRDMAFPNYWAEVRSPITNKFIPVDPIVLSTIASNQELLQTFEPRGKKAEISKQVICYTVAHNADGSAKDVTVRYLKRHQLPGKTKGVRMGIEKVPIHNRRGKVIKYENYDWFRTVMSIYERPDSKRTTADRIEDETDLQPFKAAKAGEKQVEKESLQWYKQSAEFVLEQHLRREEAIKPGARSVKQFQPAAKKGSAPPDAVPVFRRSDVLVCKTVETWHKEGREVLIGEQPIKMVPVRAVTLLRKREMEEHLHSTGEQLLQGLYSRNQTEWIIPPPIGPDRKIPKNAFGNMDVYVPSMVPRGAVHLPLKGSAKICRRLEIEYAEACTGFEFGNRRAVPVLTGVVVAAENERLVKDAWRAERAEQKRKEDTKRTDLALRWWRKMVMGLRIIDRMQREYEGGDNGKEDVNPFVRKAERERKNVSDVKVDVVDEGGGFLQDDEEVYGERSEVLQGGFLVSDDEANHDDASGGFLVEEPVGHDAHTEGSSDEKDTRSGGVGPFTPVTPVSLQSMHGQGIAESEDLASTSDELQEDKPLVPPPEQTQSKKPSSRSRSKRKTPSALVHGRPEAMTGGADTPDDEQLSELTSIHPDTDSDKRQTAKRKTKKRAGPSKPKQAHPPPQVAVQKIPAKAQRKSNPPTSGRRNGTVRKSTPTKSPYFARHDDDHSAGSSSTPVKVDVASDDGAEVEMEGDGETSEEEVVKPRATTRRTRAKAQS